MAEVFYLAVSFPGAVFTALLGVVLVYWMFVMVGAVELGEGSDGALEGSVKGALEGSAKGALEGSAKGAIEAAGDGDAPDFGEGHEASALAALMSALGLRQIPVTVSVSLIVTFAWMTCLIAMQLLTRSLPSLSGALVKTLVLVLSPLVAVPLSGIVARPLSKLFVTRHAPSRADLVGKTCIVRTGTVTHRFGEALLEDGGAGLVVRVRVDGDHAVKRGDHVLIVDWDSARDAFLVEPMSDILKPND